MELNAYLTFSGDCEAAFRFYEQCLKAKIEAMIPHEGTPAGEHVPPEWRKKILHARLVAGNTALMGSDAPPGRYQKPQGITVSVSLADAAEGERIFKALTEGGQIQMPFQQTFWAAGFGMLVDRFGIPWMVNVEKPA